MNTSATTGIQFLLRKNKVLSLLFSLAALFFLAGPQSAHGDFIGEKGHQFSGSGGWWYNSFTVSGASQTFTLYFTSRYSAAALVAPQTQLSNFTNGRSVSYVDGFDGNFGVKSITLSPGSYFVGVRNKASGSNAFSLELEEEPIESSGATFVQVGIQGAETISAGGYLVHDFTVQNGFRYIIDGNNSGNLDVYFIPREEKSNFIARQSFNYYSDFGGVGDPNEPGLVTLNLGAGDYTMAVRSRSSTTESLTYRMYIFSIDGYQSTSQSYRDYGNSLSDYYNYYDETYLALAWYYYYEGLAYYNDYLEDGDYETGLAFYYLYGSYYNYYYYLDAGYPAFAWYAYFYWQALGYFSFYQGLGDTSSATYYYNLFVYYAEGYYAYYAGLGFY